MVGCLSRVFCKITQLLCGCKYFWGIKLIFLPYTTLPKGHIQQYENGITHDWKQLQEATRTILVPQGGISHTYTSHDHSLTSKPTDHAGSTAPAAPGMQCVNTFYFWKILRECAQHCLLLSVYYLEYIHLHFFLTGTVLAWAVILVLHYFIKDTCMSEFDVILIVCYFIMCS